MLVLAFESSCDETGVALVEMRHNDHAPRVIAQALHTQMSMHEAYGGVVPELASRDHIQRVVSLTRRVMQDAQMGFNALDVVAYTKGPGLAGALLVGAGTASALALALNKPTLGVHHLEGHLLSPFLSHDEATNAPINARLNFPFVALLVSGGHTQLMRVDGVGRYALLGESIDDAAGEAFDKAAKLMGLGYPGGPALSRLAAQGDARRFKLPRPLLHDGSFNFSFAGLKTAVMMQWQRLPDDERESARADLCAATQAAIVDVLVAKSVTALRESGLKRLVVAGGVGANQPLRERLNAEAAKLGAQVHYPPLALCTDNGAMIGAAAAMRLQAGVDAASTAYDFSVKPRWPLEAMSTGV